MSKKLTRDQEKAMFAKQHQPTKGKKRTYKVKSKTINKPPKELYGLNQKQLRLVEKHVDAKAIKDYEGDTRGHIVEFDDGTEWLIFDNYDDAHYACESYVKEMLDDEPETFNQEWLKHFVYVSDTDKRMIADEQADFWEEDYRYEHEKDGGLTEKQEEYIEKQREKIYDEWYNGLNRDPIDFVCNEQGIYTKEELLKQPWIQIDTNKASKNAVNTDGVAHFFASYDGNEVDLDDGTVMYRVN